MAKTSQTMMSPKGIAVYPRLNQPDTKFDELGAYKADIAVPSEEAKPLIAKLQAIHKAHTGKAASVASNPMFMNEVDKETGEETGRVIFKFRVKNRLTKRGDLWDRQPKVFDAKGNMLSTVPNIGGGSTLKVFFEIYEWKTPDGKPGVSLQPIKVQLLDLQEFSGGDTDNPFDEEEGFTAETLEETAEDGGDDPEDF